MRSRYDNRRIVAHQRYGRRYIARRVLALRLPRKPDRGTREKAAMSAISTPLTDDPLLDAVTHAMVELHQRYHHRAPVTAKTMMLGGDLSP